MSWPLASFAIVLGILAAAWLAYERSRPSARMAAVVGTLAALAALGRDAFVAIPDVKPITAMTLVVGYALGPLPGFAVGAVGMLASNILLGQGPYTPWQMVAWGLVGLAGALLARLTHRRAGRLGLALACAFAALGAKEIMNVYSWTIGASHTPAALLAEAGIALPYDITDTVASFLFGLAFAPELARVLGRVRERMTIRWEQSAVASVVLALLVTGVLAAGLPARGSVAHAEEASSAAWSDAASSSGDSAIDRGIAYLARSQNADGGFGAEPGQRSNELYTAWSAIGLAAAGHDPGSLRRDGRDPLDALRAQASTLSGAGDLERTILALRACGASTRTLSGGDPLSRLLHYQQRDGSFSGLVNLTAFGVLAMRAAGEPASGTHVRAAAHWLAAQQKDDGGFSYAVHAPSDVDDTAAALQAVVAASVPGGPVVSRALAFLRHVQDSDGGFPLEPGDESNAQSSAWAIQGFAAAGVKPRTVRRRGHSALTYLQEMLASNGSVRYSKASSQTPVWVTAEALAAFAVQPLPVAPVAHSAARTAPARPVVASSSGRRPSKPSGTGVRVSKAGVAHAHARERLLGASSPLGRALSQPVTGVARLNSLARQTGALLALALGPVLHR